MRRILLAAAVVLGLGGVASACLNDHESERHEKEFRSQYRQTESPDESSESERPIRPEVVGAGGLALFVGALVIGRGTQRVRS